MSLNSMHAKMIEKEYPKPSQQTPAHAAKVLAKQQEAAAAMIKVPRGRINEKEAAVLTFLLAQPDNTATLGEMQNIWPDAGVYTNTVKRDNPNRKGAEEGSSIGKRWASNSVRKLLRQNAVRRVAPGMYQADPKRARGMLTLVFVAPDTKIDYTAPILSSMMDKDYPTAVSQAREVGVKPARWRRLVNGAALKEGEQILVNDAHYRLKVIK